MRSAIVHDWLLSAVGGGEKVLEAIHTLFPSPIYTLVKDGRRLQGSYFENLEIYSSFIQKFPQAQKRYKSYLPFFPVAIESFDLRQYDVVISSSHCVAKGVVTGPEQLHICYCHTPVRYAWDLMHEYLLEYRGVKRFLAEVVLHYLRGWDVRSSSRVDHFVANSNYVARRIRKFYGREAEVIYPFVDLTFFEMEEKKDDYYVTASRLVPYKRVDLIVEAFVKMGKRLVVVGDGPEWKKIAGKAGPTIDLVGYQSDQVLRRYLQRAKAFIFAATEDFGIAPVEAMACGTPVIAFGQGGVRETVVESVTGTFFDEQSVEAIVAAVERFEGASAADCRMRAEQFSKEQFNQKFKAFVVEKWEKRYDFCSLQGG
jgi:glycosyltransferase involved in cell wall biosynthesis